MALIKIILGLLRVACGASLFCSPLAWSFALDPNKPITDYIHDIWTVDQGLPHSTIRGIAQTKDSYMWFGTHEGLARFDGRYFTVFNHNNAPALKGDGISTLQASADGSLLIGLRDGGLVRHKANSFAPVVFSGDALPGTVSVIAEGARGAIWMGSSHAGVARVVDGVSRVFTTKDGLPSNAVAAIYLEDAGDAWVGTFAGLVKIRGNEVIKNPTSTALDRVAITAVVRVSPTRLLFGTNGAGYFMRDGETFTQVTTKDGLATDGVTRVFVDADGTLWLGTLEGLQRIPTNGEIKNAALYARPQGLTNNFVREMFQDADGSLWVGSDRGLDRVRDGAITTWGKQRGIEEEFVRTVMEDQGGNIWVGTAEGLFRINQSGTRRFGRDQGLLSASILSLAESKDGVFWVGTNSGGVHRLRGERFENVASEHGLPALSVRAITPARDGSVWIGSNAGVFHIGAGKLLAKYTVDAGLPNDQVLTVHEDKDGVIWVGTRAGVGVIAEGKVVPHPELKPLNGSVFSIISDKQGQFWFAIHDGLARLSGGVLKKLGSAEGVPSRAYFTVIDDEMGALWACSNEGLLKIKSSEINDLALGKRPNVVAATFGRTDGMATRQCNGGAQPASWRTRAGKLLFPIAEGVAVVTPENTERVVRKPPPVLVETIVLDGESHPIAEQIVMKPGQRRVAFTYAGISFIDPQRLRFRHRLVGFDKDWVEAGSTSRAAFTNLEEGSYKFEVIASHGDGVWSAPASIGLVREAAFYRALWFQFSLAAVLLGTAWLAYRARVLNARRNRLNLERMVLERTNELALEKQKLQVISEEKSRLLLQVHEQSEAYKKIAAEDALTGLANRRELDRMLALELQRAVRSKQPLVVVLADIDHFKQVNDKFLHTKGDEVLRRIGQLFRENCRANDVAARYGGEEFALVLPGTTMREASILCERLRRSIESQDWDVIASGLRVTMSFGIAPSENVTDPNRLLDLADAKLYQAKINGRNRVET